MKKYILTPLIVMFGLAALFSAITWPDSMSLANFPWLNVWLLIGLTLWVVIGFIFNITISVARSKQQQTDESGKKIDLPDDHPLIGFYKMSGAILSWGVYAFWFYICFGIAPYVLKMYLSTYSLEFIRLITPLLFLLLSGITYFAIQQWYPKTYGAKMVMYCTAALFFIGFGLAYISAMDHPKLFYNGQSDIWYDAKALNSEKDIQFYRHGFDPDKEYWDDTTGNILTQLTLETPELVKEKIRNKLKWKCPALLAYFLGGKGGGSGNSKGGRSVWVEVDEVTLDPKVRNDTNYSFRPGERVKLITTSGSAMKVTWQKKNQIGGETFSERRPWKCTIDARGVLPLYNKSERPVTIKAFILEKK